MFEEPITTTSQGEKEEVIQFSCCLNGLAGNWQLDYCPIMNRRQAAIMIKQRRNEYSIAAKPKLNSKLNKQEALHGTY
jgi:hypothetical protein